MISWTFLPRIDIDGSVISLTAAKESGENIVINGKKVALGIPTGGKQPEPNKPLPGIPLGRAATSDEAAQSVLL